MLVFVPRKSEAPSESHGPAVVIAFVARTKKAPVTFRRTVEQTERIAA